MVETKKLRWQWQVAALALLVTFGGCSLFAPGSTPESEVAVQSVPDVAVDAGGAGTMPDSLVAALEESEGVMNSSIVVRSVLEELILGTDVMWVETLPCSTQREIGRAHV